MADGLAALPRRMLRKRGWKMKINEMKEMVESGEVEIAGEAARSELEGRQEDARLLRKESRKPSGDGVGPGIFEYVVVGTLIICAVVAVGIWLFGAQILGMFGKPVIYLYPEAATECSVCVKTDGRLTCTYPDHGKEGWRDFVAEPDGTLTFADGRKFYCLYWEGVTPTQWDFSQGYCVKGSETGAFLADVLAKMGLSFREANEFIIYWLPRMQENPYNVIAFQGEKYERSAKLEIEPKPDSVLRVFMAWKASESCVDIPAPEIRPFERKGFTVVEWGGSEVEE